MRLILMALLCAIMSHETMASIIEVPGDAQTITAAYNQAVSGDTILLGSAIYSENLTSSKRLTVIGLGTSQTTIRGLITLNVGSNRSVFEGLRIIDQSNSVGNVQINGNVDSLVFRRCWVSNTSVYPALYYAGGAGRLFLTQCVFSQNYASNDNNPYSTPTLTFSNTSVQINDCVFDQKRANVPNAILMPAMSGPVTSVAIVGCCFFNYKRLFNFSGSFPFSFANSIVYDWNGTSEWGVYPANSTIDYIASSTLPGPIGTNFITLTANPFVNYNETNNYQFGISDLHLNGGAGGGALCVDAGVPAILDLDGSRSDLGIYGGMNPFVDGGTPNYPFVESLSVPAAITSGQDLQINAVGRIGQGY